MTSGRCPLNDRHPSAPLCTGAEMEFVELESRSTVGKMRIEVDLRDFVSLYSLSVTKRRCFQKHA